MTKRPQPQAEWVRLAALCGLLLAFTLRLFRLGVESLWYDETVSAVLASKPLPELIAHTAGDIHPPGYYLLLHGWRALTKPTLAHGLEFLLAFPSLWFGVVGTALLFVLGRKLFGAAVGVLALVLAAVHPFQIMYSQEVRMYTLAAACGLLCLWALLCALGGKRPVVWLGIYAVSAAVGLYTLYYFIFLWVALNLIALWRIWQTQTGAAALGRNRIEQTASRPNKLVLWMLAQGIVLLLWSPWLPIFWRQVTNPPVPPWRTAWTTGADLVQGIDEGVAALWVGQTLPTGVIGLWLAVTGVVALFGILASRRIRLHAATTVHPDRADTASIRAIGLPVALTFVLVPFLLIVLLSLTVTPLYHVRYLFPFAAPFMLLIAASAIALGRWQRWPAAALLVGYVGIAGWSLYHFWFDPHYRADDHRSAVAYLAEQWRPGDAILVNAGWVYTALEVYWPVEQIGPFSSLPPFPAATVRLTDTPAEYPDLAPIIVRAGSVEGPDRLGWGNSQSDFFAMPAEGTVAGLDQLAAHSDRIWHYRLYDTASDPGGLIRDWLESNTQLLYDQPIEGRDFPRLQLYQTARNKETPPAPSTAGTIFGDAIQLTQTSFPPEATAGQRFYAQLAWQPLPGFAGMIGDLAFSLRLYDPNGALIAQEDAGPLPPSSTWRPGASYQTPLSVPVPVAARPLTATLGLIAYDRSSGEPLAHSAMDAAATLLVLGKVQINRAIAPPELAARLARFDYIDLVAVRPIQLATTPGDMAGVDLVWLPRPNAYTDTYLARLTLRDHAGVAHDSWEAPLGGWDYASGIWPAEAPVLDQRQLGLASTLPGGHYDLTLQVLRASDRQLIPARRGWLRPESPEIALVSVTVAVPPTAATGESLRRGTAPAQSPGVAPLDWFASRSPTLPFRPSGRATGLQGKR